MNRFGVKPTNPKPLFGVKPEKNRAFKFLLVGETNECKVGFLTLFADNDILMEGHYSNSLI